MLIYLFTSKIHYNENCHFFYDNVRHVYYDLTVIGIGTFVYTVSFVDIDVRNIWYQDVLLYYKDKLVDNIPSVLFYNSYSNLRVELDKYVELRIMQKIIENL
jgi:hypothetical protein